MLETIDGRSANATPARTAAGHAPAAGSRRSGSEFAAAVARSGAGDHSNTAHAAVGASSSNVNETTSMMADVAKPGSGPSDVPRQAQAVGGDTDDGSAGQSVEQDPDDGTAQAMTSLAMPTPDRPVPAGKSPSDRDGQTSAKSGDRDRRDAAAAPEVALPQLPVTPVDATGKAMGRHGGGSGQEHAGTEDVERMDGGSDVRTVVGGSDPVASRGIMAAGSTSAEPKHGAASAFGVGEASDAGSISDAGAVRLPEPVVMPQVPAQNEVGVVTGTAPTAATAVQPAVAATPVEQVGAAMVGVVQRADGSGQISLSLHPGDLGHVRVEVEKNADGTMNVVVTASEPGTLRSLQGDQAHLHAALDAAAHPAADRHISFVLDQGTGTAAGGGGDGNRGAPGQAAGDGGTGSRNGQDDRGNRTTAQGRWAVGDGDVGRTDDEAAVPVRTAHRMLINVFA